MTVEFGTFTLTRQIEAPVARVYAAWADPEQKRRWFAENGDPNWSEQAYNLDFRVGGVETGRFVLASGPGKGEHRNTTHYLDIVPEERIVFAYSMALDGRVHSASLATVTFAAEKAGTRLDFTEQAAHFPPSDPLDMRQGGWTHLLDALSSHVVQGAA